MFQSSPGGNIGFEPDFKLTTEMVQIMGGQRAAEPYKFAQMRLTPGAHGFYCRWFLELCVRCYLAVRPYTEQMVSLVAMMLNTGLPCFRNDRILDELRYSESAWHPTQFTFCDRNRFQPNASESEAANYIRERINHSYLNTRTWLYDIIQAKQNHIKY